MWRRRVVHLGRGDAQGSGGGAAHGRPPGSLEEGESAGNAGGWDGSTGVERGSTKRLNAVNLFAPACVVGGDGSKRAPGARERRRKGSSMRKKWVIVSIVIVLVGARPGVCQGQRQQEAQGGGVPLPPGQGAVRGPAGQRARGGRRRPRDEGRRQVARLRPRRRSRRARGRRRLEPARCWPRSSPTSTRRSPWPTFKAAVSQADLRLRDAERILQQQKALYTAGLIARRQAARRRRPRATSPPTRSQRRARYEIVENHGIPISGGSLSQRARVTAPMQGVVVTRRASSSARP